MNMYLVITSIIFSVASIISLSKVAAVTGLVDVPDNRKAHVGHIPVIGGLAIAVSLLLMLTFTQLQWPFSPVISSLGLVLFLSGLIDDKVALAPKLRIIVQIVVAILTVFVGDLHLYFFGDIFFVGDFYLGFWGELLTVLAIVTAINAFNMIDGIDGLLALLLINVFAAMLITDPGLYEFYFVMITLLCVFLLFNLGIVSGKNNSRKIFMGDAGSMMFGYLVVCLLIDKSQHPGIEIRPVTVLWVMAIPLMDLVAIVIRRSRKKQPLMKADRDHLHHIFMRMGLSDRKALVGIICLAIAFSSFGLMSEYYQFNESLVFLTFMAVFGLYLYFILHAWRIVRIVNLLKRR